MRDLKTKYVNSIQEYYPIYLSVRFSNGLEMAQIAVSQAPSYSVIYR